MRMPPHASSAWRPEPVQQLRRDAVRIVVPASSANLGPGFDAIGLGLDVWDEYTAMVSDDAGWLIEVEGEGAGEVPLDASHLVARGMALVFASVGVEPRGLVLRCRNAIPHGRGIGSSAAAIVGGLALARALLVDGDTQLPDDDLLQLALQMESHPDNISASLFGGLTLSWVDDLGRAGSVCLPVHPDVQPVLVIPGDAVPTEAARAALPTHIPMADAVYNISRAAILGHALTQRPDLLLDATRDRLHQEPRRAMYPQSLALVEALQEAGIAAAISGAGPTVLVFATAATVGIVSDLAPANWLVQPTAVATRGAHEVPLHPAS